MYSSLKFSFSKILFGLFLFALCSTSYSQALLPEYLVGTGIRDFTRMLDGSLPHGVGTYGYVHYKEPIDTTVTDSSKGIINGVHLNLKARVLTIRHQPSDELFIYVLYDLAFASEKLRRGIMQKLTEPLPQFKSSNLMLTATHTHSAPGGFSDYLGYEVATPGCRTDVTEAIVQRTYEAIMEALENEAPMDLVFNESMVPDSIPIAFSRRALPAYNKNPEIKTPVSPEENYKATDRIWQMISFEKEGQLHSMLNLFGAHPNRMGANHISADTRGAASQFAEEALPEGGVALFSQNAPGDIDGNGYYFRQAKKNPNIVHPGYCWFDEEGTAHRLPRHQRVLAEGNFLKEQAFRTHNEAETSFKISGGIDCELIYVDMGNQVIPQGNYPLSLDPQEYYRNDYFLMGFIGRWGTRIRPKGLIARTSPPTIGLAAIARMPKGMTRFVVSLEKMLRYWRLFRPFKSVKKTNYLWNMYRSQGEKTVMLEGNQHLSAVGFPIGKTMFNAFSKFDPVLSEIARDNKIGLHDEHTMYPTIVPIQIVIIGNIAIAGVSGEPGNIAGQRIEGAILAQLRKRGVKRVIVNGYANENTGYIFTPEEYSVQFEPQQCGFVLYGRWTEPAFRYNFEKLAEAMLEPKPARNKLVNYTIQPPVFSQSWCEKASSLKFLKVD